MIILSALYQETDNYVVYYISITDYRLYYYNIRADVFWYGKFGNNP